MLVGGYTFYNTYWPNNDASAAVGVNGVIGGSVGGEQVSNSNELGGESLLRRRLSDSNVIIYGKFITYIIVYIIL